MHLIRLTRPPARRRDRAGLLLPHEVCNWADVKRDDQESTHTTLDLKDSRSLRTLEQIQSKSCMKGPGTHVELNGEHEK